MNCTAARGYLSEHALGVLDASQEHALGRHLQWCAACRREDAELSAAASVLAFSVAPATPDEELEGAVVASLEDAVRGRSRPPVRRGRLALILAAGLAGVMALGGMGWGAVMADRAARSDEAARAAQVERQAALDRFATLLNSGEFNDPDGQVYLAHLTHPTEQTLGSGDAVVLASSVLQGAMVMVSQLPSDEGAFPYMVRIGGRSRRTLVIGEIRELDADGGATVSRMFEPDSGVDLRGYTRVVVRGADGTRVLRGSLDARASISSPGPRR